VPDLLDHRRLRELTAPPARDVFGPAARAWIAAVPDGLDRIRRASGDGLPAALHEMRSGAVAVGARALAAALAEAEQRIAAGGALDDDDRARLEHLAARTTSALDAWWEGAGH
jgi:HPt (histidine-containing phosphotransfer) domain-containing protein